MNCTPETVLFGQSVICTANATYLSPSDYVAILSWEFDGGGADVFSSTSSFTWQGQMIASGVVKVTMQVNEDQQTATASVNVTRRSGWTWSSSVTGAQGTGTELDVCMGNGLGLTAGLSCTPQLPWAYYSPTGVQQSGGFTPAQITDNGPNHGAWYVNSPTARADVRTQINIEYRSTGPAHSMIGDPLIVGFCGATPARNHVSVNTACGPVTSGFTQFVAFDWAHEGRHMNAIVPAATQASNDVYKLWESLVRMSASELRSAADQVYQASQLAVHIAGAATHTGNNVTFNFWRWSNQWTFAPITVAD